MTEVDFGKALQTIDGKKQIKSMSDLEGVPKDRRIFILKKQAREGNPAASGLLRQIRTKGSAVDTFPVTQTELLPKKGQSRNYLTANAAQAITLAAPRIYTITPRSRPT